MFPDGPIMLQFFIALIAVIQAIFNAKHKWGQLLVQM